MLHPRQGGGTLQLTPYDPHPSTSAFPMHLSTAGALPWEEAPLGRVTATFLPKAPLLPPTETVTVAHHLGKSSLFPQELDGELLGPLHVLGVVCAKDKKQGKLKGPILPGQRPTGLLSLCHNVTIAMSQSPPKQHALSLSHPYKERHLPCFSPAQNTESIRTLPSQQMTYRFPGYKSRQATHAHYQLSLATRNSARCSCSDPFTLINSIFLTFCLVSGNSFPTRAWTTTLGSIFELYSKL